VLDRKQQIGEWSTVEGDHVAKLLYLRQANKINISVVTLQIREIST